MKKDSVQAIAGTPKTPFLNNITFRVYSDLSEKLWSSPSTENSTNLITEIPHLTQNIQFLGKIKGECLISGRTNIWYYCKYTEETDLYGYIYSDFCDEMPTIESNLESFEYIDNPSFEAYVEPTKTIPLTSNYIGIIIGILSVPALIFVFMIIKGTRILTKEKTRSKEVVDY